MYPDGHSLWPSGDSLLRPVTPKSRSSNLPSLGTKSALSWTSMSLSCRPSVRSAADRKGGRCRTGDTPQRRVLREFLRTNDGHILEQS